MSVVRSRKFASLRAHRAIHDASPPRHISNQRHWAKRVYAICFDLDTEALRAHYHNASWQNAYHDIRGVLETHGFSNQQGSVYFGTDRIDPVTCVLAIQDVSTRFSWFRLAVRDLRMLRIEENNDLMPAVDLRSAAMSAPPASPAAPAPPSLPAGL
jgi:virulence-associated protein VapD